MVEKLEKLATADSLRAVRFAEVVVVLLDATIPFEKQDLTLADLVEREGRALVIGLNKWDLVDEQERQGAGAARRSRPAAAAAQGNARRPGLGPDRRPCRQAAGGGGGDPRGVEQAHRHRAAQPRLAPVIDATPPPAVAGRRVKIRYITQPKARPPYFVLFGNQVEQIPESYKRYLVNGLRETFGLSACRSALSMRSGGENPYAPKKRRGYAFSRPLEEARRGARLAGRGERADVKSLPTAPPLWQRTAALGKAHGWAPPACFLSARGTLT